MRFQPILFGLLLFAAGAARPSTDVAVAQIVLDDFENDEPGTLPKNWRFLTSNDREFKPLKPFMAETEKFYVLEEGGNRFLRGYTASEAQRISLPTSKLKWSLARHPILCWDWRALRLPEGASEDSVNDTGGAVYVTFAKTDWLGRPLSIKYTYSTSLPVGTVVSTGNVKVIVVSSGKNGMGRWVQVERNVVEDYERLFGHTPPEDPYTVTLWSDSDNTRSVGEVDFDNLTIRKARK